MAKASGIQSSFLAGEVSPLLQGRVDLPRYKEGLAICQNYIPLLQGPKTRRPGTGFVFPVKDSSVKPRLVPFQVSSSQSFILEFGNQYIRVHKNRAPVTYTPVAFTAVTTANPAVVTSTAHGFSNNDRVLISGVLGMTELNNREFLITAKTANTYELTDSITGALVDSTGFSAYASGGTAGKIYEVIFANSGGNNSYAPPYLTADFPGLKFSQSDDVLYIAHPKYPPANLIRIADTTWSLFPIANNDGPYLDENIQNATVLTVTAPAVGHPNTTTVVASNGGSGTEDINGGLGFLATDASNAFNDALYGRVLRFEYSSVWYWGWIVNVDSTTQCDIRGGTSTAGATAAGANTISNWRLGLWSDTDGWPNATTFYQDRLIFGGAGADPTRFDGSQSGDYNNFAPTATDGTIAANDAYSFPLAANNLDSIVWMNSDEQGLLIGTTDGEWIVGAADSSSALSALSVSAKKTTSNGSANVQAVQLGKCTLFVQQGSKKLKEMQYNFYTTGFIANDLTQLSEHITVGGIQFIASQKTPQPIMWAVRADGTLLAMTYERDLDAVKVGWSRHVMGGSVSGGGIAKVESVAIVPSPDQSTQDVYVVVQRYINGNVVRYIEYITPFFDDTSVVTNAVFLDASLTYNGASTSTISGLNHLNGQSLTVLADGNLQTNKTPVNGRITLDTAASVVTVGLAYNSDGQKLRSDNGAADGTAMGKTRRTNRMGIQFLNTAGFQLGPDFSTLDSISLDNTTAGIIGNAAGLFTGVCTEIMSNDYNFDNMICWRQSGPFPGTILGFYPQQETQDR